MKAFLMAILIFLFSYFGSGQIVIDQDDMPNIDDTLRISTALTIDNYTETGANFTWDFADLIPVSQRVDSFVSVQSTPIVYQLVFFYPTVATIASPGAETDQIPNLQLSDVFTYYKENSSYFAEAGFAATLNGIPIPVKYDEPDIYYNFPLEYGNSDSAYSSYALQIPGLGYLGGWKVRLSHVDGWGSISTPYGTFEALRIKSDITQFDSLYVDSLGTGLPLYREFSEYSWLGKEMGLPVFKVSEQGAAPVATYLDSVRNVFTSVTEENLDNVRIAPNPVSRSHSLVIQNKTALSGNLFIKLYTLTGKSVAEIEGSPGEQVISIPLSKYNMNPGTYLIRIDSGNNTTFKKLIITD